MPNHCESDLFVEGEPDILKRFTEAAKGPEGIPMATDMMGKPQEPEMSLLSAHVFLPYPEAFQHPPRCANCGGTEPADGWTWKCKACGGPLKDGYNTGGYEWCNEHWGTKWGLYDVTLVEDHPEDGRLAYTFRSAWAPPVPVIKAMALRYPELTFHLVFYECGAGYQGSLKVRGEAVLEDWEGPYYGNRGG